MQIAVHFVTDIALDVFLPESYFSFAVVFWTRPTFAHYKILFYKCQGQVCKACTRAFSEFVLILSLDGKKSKSKKSGKKSRKQRSNNKEKAGGATALAAPVATNNKTTSEGENISSQRGSSDEQQRKYGNQVDPVGFNAPMGL